MIDVHVSRLEPMNGLSSRPATSCSTRSAAFAKKTTAPTPTSRPTGSGIGAPTGAGAVLIVGSASSGGAGVWMNAKLRLKPPNGYRVPPSR